MIWHPRPKHAYLSGSATYTIQMALWVFFKEVDYVVHLVGKVSYLKKEAKSLYEVNVSYTSSVVDACLASDVSGLIYCSSTAAVEKDSKGRLSTEDLMWTEGSNHTFYGETKHLGEMEVWARTRRRFKCYYFKPGHYFRFWRLG